jgi:hypothetical protein
MNLAAQIIALLQVGGTVGIALWQKLEQLTSLGPDEQANVKAQVEAAIAIDEDTIARIKAWRVLVGLDPAAPAAADPQKPAP